MLNKHHKKEQEAFLRHLDADPHDPVRREIYADWLEEHGEIEEAERMRKWRGAYQLLVGFARKWNFEDCTGNHGDYKYNDGLEWGDPNRYEHIPGTALSDQEIINLLTSSVREAVKSTSKYPNDYLTAMGRDLHSADDLGTDHFLFWENMEILTGERYKEDKREKLGWSCSC